MSPARAAADAPATILPIVIGTAGHIDHGKSTLVQALTGIDPDRLKEEKERGLTIDLGFAPLSLPDGRLVGIVDVPGHERFVRNMVAGATGIDLVVLVVAADDGVMPQTREHLQIMQLLGVQRGLVALTKTDLVDEAMVELAEEDVRESVRGTFLEQAAIHRVSAVSGAGLEEFRRALCEAAAAAPQRSSEGVFRMPIQRVFSKAGFGTVVTGIPVSGEARLGDVLEVLPGRLRGKVRGLNAYKQPAEIVRAGHSSAINLADVDHHLVTRGHVVATPNFFGPQTMVAARLTTLPGSGRPVVNRMRVRLHTGTADPAGEIVLLDREEIAPGEDGLVQIRLQDPIVCAPGDRFVLRLLSPMETLGGGVILEESRYRLKRFKGFVLDELAHQEASLASPVTLLESLLSRRGAELIPTEELATAVKRPLAETARHLAELAGEQRVRALGKDRWIHVDRLEEALARLRRAVDGWFAEEAHRSVVDVLELRQRTGFEPAFLAALLEVEGVAGRLALLPGGKVRPAGRDVELAPELRAARDGVLARLQQARFQPPSPAELGAELGLAGPLVATALEHLVDEGTVVHVGGELYLATTSRDEARAAIVANCERHGHLEIPELRDALGTTRKFLIPLLEHFDAQGLTIRQGAHRVLRKR